MGILSNIKKRNQSVEQFDKWLDHVVSGFPAKSGRHVNEESAMTNSAVLACIRILAETIASLPLNVYEETSDGNKKKAKNNYLYPLLHKKPNNIMTSFTFREVLMAHLLLWGNHYSKMETANGRLTGLWPLNPAKTWPVIENKRLYYKHRKEDGNIKVYNPSEILHIPGLGFNGFVGKSVIKMAKESIGLGLAAEEFGSNFFSNGAHPSGIVEYPEGLKDEARERLKENLADKYKGLGKSHNLMVFEHGMKYHQVSIPPDDAQFLETRKFQVREIARIYRVPPHMLADMEKGASYSSIEQTSIDFVVHTIRPWLVRIEQVLNDKLISSKNNKNYIEFVVEGLLRGDSQARAEYYNQMYQVGAMSPNDIRKKENMNPIDGGDQHFVPLNFIPLEEDNPKIDENNNRTELRKRRSAGKRKNIRDRYKRLIKKSAGKIVKKEVNKIRDLLNAELKSNTRNKQDFRDKIVSFYDEFPEDIQDEMKPVLRSLADAVAEEAAGEVDIDNYSIDEFFEKYLSTMSTTYAGYSRGQLLALMDEAENREEAAELVDERLAEWEEKRAEQVAERQAVKTEGAITRTVFAAGGVTKLIWVASSGACPICSEMDGKVVGIEESFMEPSDKIDAGGKDFSPSGSITHPPLHQSCQCSIISG